MNVDIRQRDVRRVLWITLALNVVVSAAKIVVGLASGSGAMTADGWHSLFDGVNNVVGLTVVGLAYAPPDPDHPYGHRKFETAATLAIGLSLLTVAYRVLESALGQLQQQRLPEITPLNWLVMGVTLLVNLFVTRYESNEGQRLGSAYLLADAAHTRSDVYVTLGVFASFAGARAGLAWVDPAIAIAIAGFIASLGASVLVGAFHTLTDRAALEADALVRLVRGVPLVQDCRDVRTRGAASAVYVDLTVLLDGALSLREAHEVADQIENVLRQAHPAIVDVVVHLEPAVAGPDQEVP